MRKHLTTISDKYVHAVRFRDYQLNEKQTEEYTDPAEWSCPLFIQTIIREKLCARQTRPIFHPRNWQ